MKDRSKTYRYSGGVKCRRNRRRWPANNGRSCQQSKRQQAPASPATQTYRRRMSIVVIVIDNTRRRNCKSTWTWSQVHLDLVAHCCRKFTTSGASTLPSNIIYYRIIRQTCLKYDVTTRKLYFFPIGYNNFRIAQRATRARNHDVD